jgi:hypothetical protein
MPVDLEEIGRSKWDEHLRGNIGEDLYDCPPNNFVGTVLVLVAADIKSRAVLVSGAILTDVGPASDFDDGPEPKLARTRDGVLSATDIGSRSGYAGMTTRLARDRVVAGHVCTHLATRFASDCVVTSHVRSRLAMALMR